MSSSDVRRDPTGTYGPRQAPRTTAGNAIDTASQVAREATDKAGDLATQAKDKAKEVGAKVGEFAKDTKDKAQEWASSAVDSVTHAKDKAQEWATEAAGVTSEAAQDLGREITSLIRKYPMQSLLLGFGLGFLIAKTTRNT